MKLATFQQPGKPQNRKSKRGQRLPHILYGFCFRNSDTDTPLDTGRLPRATLCLSLSSFSLPLSPLSLSRSLPLPSLSRSLALSLPPSLPRATRSRSRRAVPTDGPSWGYPKRVLGADSAVLKPFCGYLSLEVDKSLENRLLEYPHEELGVVHQERQNDNLPVRIHFIIVMIGWTGLAPWKHEFPFPGSLTATFLTARENAPTRQQCQPACSIASKLADRRQ